MPTVSVIVPCYNHAHYLPFAMRSILAQTFTDWEAIIVDDGSTDNTREVAAQFADPRVRYIHQGNRGLSGARNTGIREAMGEYLCFLDADDEWYPTFLSGCIDTLKTQTDPRIVGVYTSHVFIDEAGQVLPQPGNAIVPPNELPARLVKGNFFPPCVVMVRSDVVREVGLFDENLRSVEDKDLWFRLTRRYTFLGIAQALAKYRVCPGSMSTDADRMHVNRIAVLYKHFGSDEGNPAQWSLEKRIAYSRGYRISALQFIEQGDVNGGWELLLQGARISDEILHDFQTYITMVLNRQPRGYRGQLENLDIVGAGAEMLHAIDIYLKDTPGLPTRLYKTVRATVYLAMAQLADSAGDWKLARHYIWRAVFASPKVLVSPGLVRRIMKLSAGRKLTILLRSWFTDLDMRH